MLSSDKSVYMPMNDEEILTSVKSKIRKLSSAFRHNPEKFLTEEDVRCYLYHLLLDDFNHLEETEDGKKSIPLHSEVRWYSRSGNSRDRSDIAIFDPASLSTTDSSVREIPSKSYLFSEEPKIIIEIKLRRHKIHMSDDKFRALIKKDRDKIRFLRERKGWHSFKSFIIIFDKRNNIRLDLENTLLNKTIYISSIRQKHSKRVGFSQILISQNLSGSLGFEPQVS